MLAAKFARNTKRRFPFSFSAKDVLTDQERLWPMKAAVVIKVPWKLERRTDGRGERAVLPCWSVGGVGRVLFARSHRESGCIDQIFAPTLVQ